MAILTCFFDKHQYRRHVSLNLKSTIFEKVINVLTLVKSFKNSSFQMKTNKNFHKTFNCVFHVFEDWNSHLFTCYFN